MAKQLKTLKRKSLRTPQNSANTRVGADILLRMIRESRNSGSVDSHYLLPAYVVSVCAAIEHRLNEAYITHFSQAIGRNYGPYVAPYVRLKIEDKIGILIPLISDFTLEVNRKHQRIQFLFKLFRLRNRLIHQVPHLIDAEFEELEGGQARITFATNQFRHSHSHPEWKSVTRKDLVAIHAALNYWMPWLYNIATRIRSKRFNHQELLIAVVRK